MLKQRVITSLLGLPIVIAAAWFDRPLPWFTVLIVIWALLALWEFYRLAAAGGAPVLTYFGLGWALLVIISPHLDEGAVTLLLLTAGIMLSLIWLVLRPHHEGAFAGWAWTLAGVLYLGWLSSYLVTLRLDAGRNWVFFTLFCTFASDTTAYFIGRAFGKQKLAPDISPKKTWEGAIGGVLGAMLMAALLAIPSFISIPIGYSWAVLLGALVSIFGQFGDLAKSVLKRNVGVKDSGKSLPGHGGFLDRFDSVVFAGVVVYYAVMLVG